MVSRQDVIDSVLEMFNDFGLDITMDDIADYMHVSKKTLYRLFRNKEELMTTIIEYAFESINAHKLEIASQDMPVEEKLPLVMKAIPDNLKNLDLVKVGGLWKKYPVARPIAEKYMNESWTPIKTLLNEGIENGIFRDIDDKLIKYCLTSTIDTLFNKGTLSSIGMSHDEAMEKFIGLLMNGIMK